MAVAAENQRTLVFFDLETTGLDTSACDIVQLSAISGERRFNMYMMPRQAISEGASIITGLRVQNQSLFLNGTQVETTPHLNALTSFISFLQTFNRPLLAGHNCRTFDCPILLRILSEFNLIEKFLEVVSDCLDTLQVSRKLFVLERHTLGFLVQHFLKKPYNAHNAIGDVEALQELYQLWSPKADFINGLKFTLNAP